MGEEEASKVRQKVQLEHLQPLACMPVILSASCSEELCLCRGDNYIEVDVDVGSSRTAANVVGTVQGSLKSLVIDLAVLLEGHSTVSCPACTMAEHDSECWCSRLESVLIAPVYSAECRAIAGMQEIDASILIHCMPCQAQDCVTMITSA